MNRSILLSAFTFSLLTLGVGCNQLPADQTTITTTTPVVIQANAKSVDQTADGQIYKNKELGFELKMPVGVYVDKVFNDKDNRLVMFKGANETFEVRIIKDKLASLDTYYYLGFPVSSKSTLGGKVAVVFEAPQGYCDGPAACSSPFIAYSTKNGDDFYNLVFKEVIKINATEKSIVSSFKFLPAEQVTTNQTVKIFFNNIKFDPALLDCSKVYPVNRTIEPTLAVARASLEELIKGLIPGESDLGYLTNVNKDVKIQKLTIEKGVAKVDFSAQLENGVGGSCRTAAIIAQIKRTLEQFSTIKNVEISIDGRTEDILQP